MPALSEAILNWWESKRPLHYTLEDHIKNPCVNLATESQHEMARKAAAIAKKEAANQEAA